MIEAIEQLQRDFTEKRGPFDEGLFPEKQLLDEAEPYNKDEKAALLTAFCTLDYNRDAMQLKDNLVELYWESAAHADPSLYVSRYSQDDLAETFEEIGFRYYNRDAKAIYENYTIISEEYGSVRNFIESTDYNAPELVGCLRDYDFTCLKGAKLAPFYARVVNDYIHELEEVWAVPIPVDVHIRRLSRDLFGSENLTDGEIREQWRRIGRQHDIQPHLVDGALWQVGNNWDNWGEEYWNNVCRD